VAEPIWGDATDDVAPLNSLELENAKLKRSLVEKELDNDILRIIAGLIERRENGYPAPKTIVSVVSCWASGGRDGVCGGRSALKYSASGACSKHNGVGFV